jgi:hypothetical protein
MTQDDFTAKREREDSARTAALDEEQQWRGR